MSQELTIRYPQGEIVIPVEYLQTEWMRNTLLWSVVFSKKFKTTNTVFLMYQEKDVLPLIDFIRDGMYRHVKLEVLDYITGSNELLPYLHNDDYIKYKNKKFYTVSPYDNYSNLSRIQELGELVSEAQFEKFLKDNYETLSLNRLSTYDKIDRKVFDLPEDLNYTYMYHDKTFPALLYWFLTYGVDIKNLTEARRVTENTAEVIAEMLTDLGVNLEI